MSRDSPFRDLPTSKVSDWFNNQVTNLTTAVIRVTAGGKESRKKGGRAGLTNFTLSNVNSGAGLGQQVEDGLHT